MPENSEGSKFIMKEKNKKGAQAPNKRGKKTHKEIIWKDSEDNKQDYWSLVLVNRKRTGIYDKELYQKEYKGTKFLRRKTFVKEKSKERRKGKKEKIKERRKDGKKEKSKKRRKGSIRGLNSTGMEGN